jgi:hypothetical protein
MRLNPGSLGALLLALIAPSARASTLAQTQLGGVRGANVLCFVSQYLPPDIKALEPELVALAKAALTAGELKTTSTEGQYLTIDVTGEPVESCPGNYLVSIRVAFEEPLLLKRAPEQPLPNSGTIVTWERAGSVVIPASDLGSRVRETVRSNVEGFVELVQSMNRPAASGKSR